MRSHFLGTIVLTAILSLRLSISILERRKDFAVMKALGAPGGFLPGLIIQQALLISCIGILSAVILFFPMIGLIEQVAPEVSAKSSAGQILTVGAEVVLINLLREYAEEQNKCVIVASHDLRITASADRVIWLEDGAISGKGATR